MATAERFGHRQHVHLTWLAVRRYGTAAAVDLISDGIQRTARFAGAPQKYNATVSRAWVELVGHHAGQPGTADFGDFDAFVDQHSGSTPTGEAEPPRKLSRRCDVGAEGDCRRLPVSTVPLDFGRLRVPGIGELPARPQGFGNAG
ncbi:hypothetical protein ACWC0C_44670 [Streptomyces sp. NPDC001709]